MFPALIHEGETVISPSGRKWAVLGWEVGHKHVTLQALDNPEEFAALAPTLLRAAGGANGGATLAELAEEQHDADEASR